MSILDVTEDQIFHTLGKGRDPNFKPIEKVRPVIARPKKTYTINQTVRTAQTVKPMQPQVVQAVVEPVTSAPLPQVDDSMKKLTEEINALNNSLNGIQKMVKWNIMQFVIVVALLLTLIVKS